MFRKALSLLLMLSLLTGTFGITTVAKSPLASSGNLGENIHWTFNSETGGLRISGSGPLPNYEKAGDSPFCDRDEITSLIIDSGVTTVGSYLFSGCSSLRHLMLGEDVKTVYYGAFMDCTSLQNVALGSSVQSIYKSAFHNTDLRNVYCANDVNWFNSTLSISAENGALQDSGTNRAFECEIDLCGDTVFYAYMPDMKRTVILGSGAMEDFDWDMNPSPIRNGEIQTAFICNEITHVSDCAFFGCNKLAAIDVEYANKDYVSTGGVLYNADKTVLVSYPEARAYMSVIIPQSVTEIRPGAFGEGASYLKTITLYKALQTVGYGAFEYCETLTTVNYGGSEADWDKIDIEDANDPLLDARRNVTITALDLSVAAPEIGKTPQTNIAMTYEEATLSPVTIKSVTWSPADETFQTGTAYTVSVAVKAKDGYLLPGTATDIDARINGETAAYEFKQDHDDLMNVTQEYAVITYTFPTTVPEPEITPIPVPKNVAWNGSVATWETPCESDLGFEYDFVYCITIYKLGVDDVPVALFSDSDYRQCSYDASMLILRNGYGKYCFKVCACFSGSDERGELAVSPTVEFTAEELGKVPLPEPSVSSGWSLTWQGSEPLYWTLKWTYSQSTQLAPDAKYHFHVTLYKNDEMVTETDVDSDEFSCDFDADDELPYDSDDEFYIRVKAVPDEDETRYAESQENSGKGYASIVPTASLTRKLVDPEMELVRAGDTAMYFRTGWTGCYGGVKYMYIRLKITSADEEHTVTERNNAYWTLNYITGSRTRFSYTSYLDYTFKAGDFVEWEVYLSNYYDDEFANVSGSFTVEESVPHTVTLDACGKGENTTVTVPDRGYLSDVENVENLYPVVQGYRILGWSKVQKPVGEYVSADYFYGKIYENMTLYAILKPMLDEVEVNVSTLKCGDEIRVVRDKYASWYYLQTPSPELTVPEDAPYCVFDSDPHWQTYVTNLEAPEDPPYLEVFDGVVKGGEQYYVRFCLRMNADENGRCEKDFAAEEDMKFTGNFTSFEVLNSNYSTDYSELVCLVGVKAEHVWGDWEVTTAPTATDKGEATRVCADCGETETMDLPVYPHQLTLVSAKEPTCTEPGNIEYYTCSHCDKLFADPTAETEIPLAETVVPATGHAWGAWTKLDDNSHQRVCANDPAHKETEAHIWNESEITKPATCTEPGVKTFTCTVCSGTKIEAVEPTGHAWGAWTKLDDNSHQRVCANDPAHKETEAHIWNEGEITTPATCTYSGLINYICTVCRCIKTDILEPIGHTWGNWEMVDETNHRRVCLNNSTHVENEAHVWNEGTVTRPATYTTAGAITYTCTVCSATKTGTIPQLTQPEEPDAVITVATVTALPGKTASVTVDLSRYAPMSYLRLTLAYDTEALTLTDVSSSGLFATLDQGANLVFSADEDIASGGILVTLTFTVSEDAEPGGYPVTLICRECFNSAEKPVFVEIENGAVVIQSVLLGDVNGDGSVDGRDLIRLRKYLANLDDETGLSTAEISLGADVTGDGIVDGRDLIRLRRYFAYYDDETGTSPIQLG